MKFRVLYNTKIGDKYQKAGDIIDLPDGTDRNFLQRMQTIGALQAISEEDQNDDDESGEDDKDASATDKTNKTAGNKQTKGNKDK